MSMAGIVQNRRHQRRTDVAILKSPPRPPKNETLKIRVEERIKTKLHKYAEFIDSSESYVVSEALKMLFKKDEEFKSWLQDQLHNRNHPQNGEGPVIDNVKNT
jgi:predicted transcriptional regulator